MHKRCADCKAHNVGAAAAGLLEGSCLQQQHLLPAPSDAHDAASRLLETTFQCDVVSARDFCEADDRWSRAVQLLDVSDRAGWELLAAMLNPEWRLRPTAESTLVHRFLSSAIFESSNM